MIQRAESNDTGRINLCAKIQIQDKIFDDDFTLFYFDSFNLLNDIYRRINQIETNKQFFNDLLGHIWLLISCRFFGVLPVLI